MEKIYKNNNILFKIIPCVFIAIYIVSFLYGSTVCASSEYYCEDLDCTFTFGDTYDDYGTYILVNPKVNPSNYQGYDTCGICLIASKSAVIFEKYNNGYYVSTADNSPFYLQFILSPVNGELKDIIASRVKNFNSKLFYNRQFLDYNDISNIDNMISYKLPQTIFDMDGNVVFQGASQEELAGVTIPAIQSAEEIPQAIIKAMKVVIPVGLVILGIGLVIYLIKSVILRM